MRVATVDGLVTLYYDGSKPLFDEELNKGWELNYNQTVECKQYINERNSWQQVIIVDGVTEIPENTFYECRNIRKVIFADTVIRIGRAAFKHCESLAFCKLSLNLRFICSCAFEYCDLSSVFIPPRCRKIGNWAFYGNANLIILNVPQDTDLGHGILESTELFTRDPNPGSINNPAWFKNVNNFDQFALHRVCSSFQPTLEMILNTMLEKGGPKAFKVENGIGIIPSRYLKENPYAHVTEKEVIEKYVLQMMGEL